MSSSCLRKMRNTKTTLAWPQENNFAAKVQQNSAKFTRNEQKKQNHFKFWLISDETFHTESGLLPKVRLKNAGLRSQLAVHCQLCPAVAASERDEILLSNKQDGDVENVTFHSFIAHISLNLYAIRTLWAMLYRVWPFCAGKLVNLRDFRGFFNFCNCDLIFRFFLLFPFLNGYIPLYSQKRHAAPAHKYSLDIQWRF